MKLVEEEWEQTDTRIAKYGQNVNEHLAEKVSRILSGEAIHCPVGPDIVRLEVSRTSKLKVGPCPSHIGHCLVGSDIV
jgi:hypothetical protein